MNNVRRNLIDAINEVGIPTTQVLEYSVDANGNEIPERTPNARPAGPTDSNVVVFQMMLHYKRQLECEQEINAIAMKKLKKAHNDMASLQHEHHEVLQENRLLVNANQRGAMTVVRKHQAGMRIAKCLDDMFDTIDLVVETGLGDDGALGMEYIAMHKQAIQQRAEIALELFTDIIRPEDDFDTDDEGVPMMAHEVIDLTGDETEEDDI